MNWAHVHLALNHVPVLGTVFLVLLLGIGMLKRSFEIQKLALQGLLLLALVSIPIKFTGDFAAEQSAEAAGWDKALVLQHEESADQATAGVFLMGIATLASLLLNRKKAAYPRWAVLVPLLLGAVTIVLMVRTAQAGGLINHPEIRPAAGKSSVAP